MRTSVLNPSLVKAMSDDPFFSEDVCLDTSGLSPNFWPEPREQDDPFAQAAPIDPAQELRKAITRPDKSTLTELAQQQFPRDREAQQQFIRDNDPERRSMFHVSGWRCQLGWTKGKWTVAAVNEKGESKSFSLSGIPIADRDSAMAAADKHLRQFAPLWRELTEDQLILVSRIASGGALRDIESALYSYLNYAGIQTDISGDARYQDFCNAAVWFVFREAKTLTSEAEQWMLERLGDHPATINRLYAIFEEWEDESRRRRHPSYGLFNPPANEPPTPESVAAGLDDLSDESLAAVYRQTARHIARG